MGALSGKTALVTGANSGIGLEACVKLAGQGAKLVMVARNEEKGNAAVAEVKRRSGPTDVSLMLCDFSSQAAVRALAAEFRKTHDRLDVLVNNAGSVNDGRVVTVDGLEQTFAVNHLGYFLLTNLLLDLVEKSAPARIVNVSSVAHRRGDMNFADLQYEKGGYNIIGAYARSKLANVLFTTELARRLAGKKITVTCLHPGAVATEIWGHAPWYAKPFLAVAKMFMITSADGGDRIVHLAASPDVEGQTGGYYEKDKLVRMSKLAADEVVAKRLWEESAKLCKL